MKIMYLVTFVSPVPSPAPLGQCAGKDKTRERSKKKKKKKKGGGAKKRRREKGGVNMLSCQYVEVSRCQGVEVSRCEGVRGCFKSIESSKKFSI